MKKTIVLGLGVSGVAAVKFLVSLGRSVIGVDGRLSMPEGERFFSCLALSGVSLQAEGQTVDWDRVEEVIVSPGIAPSHPIYRQAIEKGIPVRGEAELALPYFKKPLVGVTGTNGKTTVTLLVEHCLNLAGIKAKALGNVGVALCDYLLNPGSEEAFVVELSSYQLETMRSAVFRAAVLLNITPDHLDRYASLRAYAEAKCSLASLIEPGGAFFVHKKVQEEYGDLLHDSHLLGWDDSCDLWTNREAIFEGETLACLLPMSYKTCGRHDCENALAAWSLCRQWGVTAEEFQRALSSFHKPSHRIEWVREIGGVAYYDDSKGTNIDAVIQAVHAMPSDVVLIVGGVDKGASYYPWRDAFSNKVKHLVTLGQAAEKIERELSPYFVVSRVCSLEAAVQRAAQLAKKGDCVLLSPGCSSFDMFRNYAHRGREFQRCVKSLNEEKIS